MTYRREKDLQEKLIANIKETYRENAWIFKTHDQCRVGIPDLIICFYGHFLAIELKRRPRKALRVGDARRKEHRNPELEDKDVTQMQRYNIKKINRAQGSAFVGRDIPKIMEKLEKIRDALLYFKE